MNHLFNTVKPVGKRVVVAIDTNDKNTHKVIKDDGTEVELFVNTDYSWDSKVTAYTQAVLLTDFKNLKAGTHVLIHHNSLNEGNKMELEYNTTTRFHSIEEDFVYFGIDGERVLCLDGYMLIERIYDEDTVTPAGLILVEKKKEDSMFKVIGKPDSITDFEIGDIAIAYKYSDYEINCKINGKMQKLIRLKYSDCLAKA
jgi:co-chaperonin GroES (HSP10)